MNSAIFLAEIQYHHINQKDTVVRLNYNNLDFGAHTASQRQQLIL